MPLKFVRADITQLEVDAIVNTASRRAEVNPGLDRAINSAAGPELKAARAAIGEIPPGQARITGGYNLRAGYIIHTVGPWWEGGARGERAVLAECYRNSLKLAEKNGCGSLAFPLISAGIHGFPKAEAMNIAVQEINSFLFNSDMTVYLNVWSDEAFMLSKRLTDGVQAFIDSNYVAEHDNTTYGQSVYKISAERRRRYEQEFPDEAARDGAAAMTAQPEASFTATLFRMIDQRGLTDPQVYNAGNISRQVFANIRREGYNPKKRTVLALCIALRLSVPEARELLASAGYAFSNAQLTDVIIKYCLESGVYDIMEVNELLYEKDQECL
jgi:O-acetyl-ADP-ribose deacetylase (regulator of RNase III)